MGFIDTDTTVSILLWVAVPSVMWLAGRTIDKSGRWRRARAGAWIGAIALPLSLLAYSFYWFVPVVGIIIGLPGLLALGWHLSPFTGAFDELVGAFLPTGHATGAFSAWKPTVFWSIVYATLGAALDVKRWRRTSHGSKGLNKQAG
jgi:hypothetical protein